MIARSRPQPDAPLIIFAGGGTGGHLYPALAVAEALHEINCRVRIAFFVSDRAVDEKILTPTGHTMVPQPLPRVGATPWQWAGFVLGLRSARRFCRQGFQTDRPSVVIGTGGLSSFFAVREAIQAGIPSAILNPDAIPGRANRLLIPRVDCVFAQWEESLPHLRRARKVILSGCPTRCGFVQATRGAGNIRFGLNSARKTLLVTGASQGARNINRCMLACLDLFEPSDWQILHLTGETDYEEVRSAYADRRVCATVLPYTHDMAEALAVADLVVARAGASFLAELTVVGRASILLPYPFHRDQHQRANAHCLSRHGAAVIVEDRREVRLTAPILRSALSNLMGDDHGRESMAASAASFGRRDAAQCVAIHILKMGGDSSLLQAGESLQALC